MTCLTFHIDILGEMVNTPQRALSGLCCFVPCLGLSHRIKYILVCWSSMFYSMIKLPYNWKQLGKYIENLENTLGTTLLPPIDVIQLVKHSHQAASFIKVKVPM
jgi:hypothetical protein